MKNKLAKEFALRNADLIVDMLETNMLANAQMGICVLCGSTDTQVVEGDARNVKCDSCGEHEVYNPEVLIQMCDLI